MKKISIILILSASFLSCKKSSEDKPNDTKKNTVTYNSPFTGITYTVSEASSESGNNYPTTYVDAGVEQATDFSRFWLDVVGPNLPFTLEIRMPRGPVGIVGWYTTKPSGGSIKIKDKFSNIGALSITKDTVYITLATKSKIEGSYVLHVADGSSSKRVTGTFIINHPTEE